MKLAELLFSQVKTSILKIFIKTNCNYKHYNIILFNYKQKLLSIQLICQNLCKLNKKKKINYSLIIDHWIETIIIDHWIETNITVLINFYRLPSFSCPSRILTSS